MPVRFVVKYKRGEYAKVRKYIKGLSEERNLKRFEKMAENIANNLGSAVVWMYRGKRRLTMPGKGKTKVIPYEIRRKSVEKKNE